MAVVYLATDARHGRPVAVKVLHPQLASSIGPGRFLREIAIAARLTHPHILPLFDSGHTGDLLYYVMPFVAGESLRERLDRDVQLPVEFAVQVALDVAAALDAAHHQGIVHRDIKPANILLEGDEAMVADFGIARALHVAAGATISEPGVVVGTPAYMSPEQGSGEREVDGRSDVYSLGCVLYEMLAGEPPFTGATAQTVLARHLTEPPRPLGTIRPGVPPALEAVIHTMLAKVPADRYQSAGELMRALRAASGTSGAIAVPERRRGWLQRLGLPWVIALLVLAGVAAGALAFRLRPATPVFDEELVMVAPFAHRAGVAPELIDGELCELLLHRAVAHWDGIRLVDPLWVADARARRGISGAGLEGALAIARERRAGRLLTGQMYRIRDTLFIYGALYDVRRAQTIRAATVALSPDLRDVSSRFRSLARSLIAGFAERGDEAADTAGTRSIAAWRSFDEGMRAFRRWELDSAAARFERAIAEDPRYPQPRLWLAQLRLIAGDDEGWRAAARQAADYAPSLPAVEAARARGLRHLADRRYPEACEEYAALVARDSLDFLAWFGLGECRQRDRLVVADARSPSGWRFRSSPHAAADAYRRALQTLPSSHALFRGGAFARLGGLLLTEPTYFRLGYRIEGDTVRLGAWPGLEADTLLLIPWPLEQLLAGRAGTVPPTHAAAVARGRSLQREIATTWARAFPNGADAAEALARAHETAGQLDESAGGENALAETRRARRLAAGPQAVRLASAEVRILVKRERFGEAARLADSVLDSAPEAGPEAAGILAGLAALTGRAHLAAGLARRAAADDPTAFAWDGTLVRPPPAIAADAAALLAYASLGAPADSIRTLHRRALGLMQSSFPPSEQRGARNALLGRAEDFAFFDAGIAPADSGTPAGYIRAMEWALSRGDTAGARRRAAAAVGGRAGRPGEVTVDGVFLEAKVLAAVGDSAAAARHLDATLTALPALGADLVDQVALAASLGRAMVLRARLAAAAGDRGTARRWATSVSELWMECDEPLRPLLAEMEALAS